MKTRIYGKYVPILDTIKRVMICSTLILPGLNTTLYGTESKSESESELSRGVSLESTEQSSQHLRTDYTILNSENQTIPQLDISGKLVLSIKGQQVEISIQGNEVHASVVKAPNPTFDDVPDITNKVGYCCGRTNSCYTYAMKHPQDDCCPWVVDPSNKPDALGPCAFCNVPILQGCGMSGVAIMDCAGCWSRVSHVAYYSPLIATASLAGCWLTHYLTGVTIYNCARCNDNTDFAQSFTRGQLYRPGDPDCCFCCVDSQEKGD